MPSLVSSGFIVVLFDLYFWLTHWASADVSRYGSEELGLLLQPCMLVQLFGPQRTSAVERVGSLRRITLRSGDVRISAPADALTHWPWMRELQGLDDAGLDDVALAVDQHRELAQPPAIYASPLAFEWWPQAPVGPGRVKTQNQIPRIRFWRFLINKFPQNRTTIDLFADFRTVEIVVTSVYSTSASTSQ